MSIQRTGVPPPPIFPDSREIKNSTTTKLFGRKVTSPQQGLQSHSTLMKPLQQGAPLLPQTRESAPLQPHNLNPRNLLPEGSTFNRNSGEFQKTVVLSSKEGAKITESIAQTSRKHLSRKTEMVTLGDETEKKSAKQILREFSNRGNRVEDSVEQTSQVVPTDQKTSVQVSKVVQMGLRGERIVIKSEDGEHSISVRNKNSDKEVRSVVSEVLKLAGQDKRTASGLLSLLGQGILQKVHQSILLGEDFHNSQGYSQVPPVVDGRSTGSVILEKKGLDYQVTGHVTKSFWVMPGPPKDGVEEEKMTGDLQVDEGKMTMEVSVIADGNALKSGEVKLRMESPPRARISGKLSIQKLLIQE